MVYTSIDNIINNTLSKARTNVLCLDGTSCCYKSSILQKSNITPVLKVQKSTSFVNSNSYAPTMMGYIYSGTKEILEKSTKCLMDRSPLNVLEWYVLWKLMNIYFIRHGNTNPADVQCSTFLTEFDMVFNYLKTSYYYKRIHSFLDVIAIINSDTEKCDAKRRFRNQGSDYERSNWLYYTYLQNRMYKLLYPFIDLAWFDDNKSDIVQMIANSIKTNMKMTKVKHPMCFKTYKLPSTVVDLNGIDPVLQNFHSYVYREHGRIDVQSPMDELSIMNQQLPVMYLPVMETEHYTDDAENGNDVDIKKNQLPYVSQLQFKNEFDDNDESEYQMLYEIACS